MLRCCAGKNGETVIHVTDIKCYNKQNNATNELKVMQYTFVYLCDSLANECKCERERIVSFAAERETNQSILKCCVSIRPDTFWDLLEFSLLNRPKTNVKLNYI